MGNRASPLDTEPGDLLPTASRRLPTGLAASRLRGAPTKDQENCQRQDFPSHLLPVGLKPSVESKAAQARRPPAAGPISRYLRALNSGGPPLAGFLSSWARGLEIASAVMRIAMTDDLNERMVNY